MMHALGNKIAEGGCAEIYEWEGTSKIIKLAKPNTNKAALEAELHHGGVAWECGLPVPRPYGMEEVNGRLGIVFERVSGDSIMQRFVKKAMRYSELRQNDGSEDLVDARLNARLLHRVHSHSVSGMSQQRDNIKHDICRANYLSKTETDAVLALLEQLPVKQQLCHGDPNPGNVIVGEREAYIVDWNNASSGNPEADLAEYIIMLRYAILPEHLPNDVHKALDAAREESVRAFMAEYEGLSGIGFAEVDPWIVPVAARKLVADAISEAEKQLLLQVIRSKISL